MPMIGWDGSASLKNPSDLFSQIQNRYSPHVLAAVFMGHIHDEVIYTNYANNGTVKVSLSPAHRTGRTN